MGLKTQVISPHLYPVIWLLLRISLLVSKMRAGTEPISLGLPWGLSGQMGVTPSDQCLALHGFSLITSELPSTVNQTSSICWRKSELGSFPLSVKDLTIKIIKGIKDTALCSRFYFPPFYRELVKPINILWQPRIFGFGLQGYLNQEKLENVYFMIIINILHLKFSETSPHK